MEDDEKLSYRRLHNRTYRSLQQLAKSLDLPSNFKKMYLIELIQAKKFKSQTEVDNIIHRVKLERLQTSRAKRESRRRRLQYTELPSTSKTCFSPQITQTPKRPGHMYIPYTEAQKSLLTYNPKRNLMQNLNQNPLPSDRVLRSFNMKTVKPNYALLSGQDIKPQANSRETRIKIVANGGFPQFNVTAKCIVKKHKPNILHNSLKRPLMLTQGPDLLHNPSKRQRTLSGIYPIMPETIPRDLHSTESVRLRKMDGSLTKINALVQKRNIDLMPRPKNNYRNAEMNIQDVVNTINDTFTDNLLAEPSVNNNYMQIEYPNMSSLDNVNCNLNSQMPLGSTVNDNLDMYSVYYHKKIRSEQIRCQKLREMQESDRLPRINDVFSKFNNIHRFDLTQPLYVQVSTESERSQSHPLYTNKEQYNTIMLETVYNFKNQMLINAPLLQVATTASTKLVYATPTVTTPIAQPSTIVSNDYLPSFEVDDHRHSDVDPRLYEFLQCPEQNPRRNYYQNEDFNTSTSSLETSQDVSTATIPEMVEDALEIISQDGDYMESLAMDIQVECILCSWAGPRMILEYHIRKEHARDIVSVPAARWRVALAAGGARVLQHAAALYVLRARAHGPAHVQLTLTSLSTEEEPKLGSITVYNRLSGEPFTWSGHIQSYFHCDSENCLKVELSRLNLLPNSANVKLINRELVSESSNKVIVGQSMLNEIHMVLHVKIFN